MTTCHEAAHRILLVVDVEETRDAIETLLQSDGYQVIAVRNVQMAMVEAQRRRPDLILVSLGGSLDSLLASARRIRQAIDIGPIVPVVMFPLPGMSEGQEKAVGERIFAILPDTFDQLRALLTRVLESG